MFGDNLSLISDTTVAATRTQGVPMREKFLSNIFIAAPAALVALVVYGLIGSGAATTASVAVTGRHLLLVTPYIFILILALFGVNVMALLFAGTVISAALGFSLGCFGALESVDIAGKGMLGMSETLIVAMLAGGLFAIVRDAGGIAWLVQAAGRIMRGPRSCEAGIALLTAAVNAFTANNTVAIVIAGPVARECAQSRGMDPVRTASILDTASCIVQGVIPYGAQILIALGVARAANMPLDGLSVVTSMYYPMLLAIAVAASIALRLPRSGQRYTAA